MPNPPTTRFAPSPTGRLHLGNARTALFSYLLARAAGGRFILRVEDTDTERGRDDFLRAQLADLEWLGIDWDSGPGREDERGPYHQSARGEIYATFYQRLVADGTAYPCYCSPTELEVARRTQIAAGQPPRYAGTCRGLTEAERSARTAAGRRPTLRFRVPDGRRVEFTDLVRGPQSFETDTIGDFVIRRADGVPVFFFCNALDDALMRVTHVLRGEDHVANTPRQVLLLEALGLAAPAYGHLPLLLGEDGTPLSKRRGSVSVGDLRDRGFLPGAVRNYLLRLGHAGAPDGWVEPAAQPAAFSLERVGRAPAHFDEVQLIHWQREGVKRLDAEALDAWLEPALPATLGPAERRRVGELVQHNVVFPDDARHWADVLFGELPEIDESDRARLEEAGSGFFATAVAVLDATGSELGPFARELKARTGRKGAALFMPLRIALTGRHDGPELAPLLGALPPAKLRDRLQAQAEATQGQD